MRKEFQSALSDNVYTLEGSEICSSFTFSHAYFLAIWQSFINQVWLEMAWIGWRGEGHWLETTDPINLRDSKRNCVLNMRLKMGVLRYRDATQQAEEDYPSQPCGISHFSRIILAYELKTADLQDLDLSTTWAQLEFSWVIPRNILTQSGSGIQRKTFGTPPGPAIWCPHLRLVTIHQARAA